MASSSSCLPSLPVFTRRAADYYREAKVMVFWDTDTAPLPDSVDPGKLINNILNGLTNAGYQAYKLVFRTRLRACAFSIDDISKLDLANQRAFPRVRTTSRNYYHKEQGDYGLISRYVLVDMFNSVRRLKCPLNYMAISGDTLFLRPLAALKDRGHNTLIARPSIASNLFDDNNIATTVWDWNDLAKGRPSLLPIVHKLDAIQEDVSIGIEANESNDLSQKYMQFGQLKFIIDSAASDQDKFLRKTR